MEANPSSIELKSMQAFHALGINRVSIGVQALRPELLQALGRIHSREAALQALETVFAAGIKNVSVDLLCGVPEQSESDLKEALKTLTQFPITHLSCYLLTLPKHHKMFPQLPSDEVQLAHLLLVHDWLTEAGFEHYEISNFAKPGKKAQHNLRYWQGHSYLGVGPSAHSYDASRSKRWKNISSLHKYSELLGNHQSVIEWTETLSPKQLELEKWMLAIRLNEGFPEEWLRPEGLRSKATVFQQEGLLEIHPHNPQRLRLTPKGFALSDQILRSLV
jgi:oxygen-independent coproporphyrinogen-3 oxidase